MGTETDCRTKMRDMEEFKIRKTMYRKRTFFILAALLLIALVIIRQRNNQETGYSIIQAIIRELPDYRNEIESWGYKVSVLPKMTGEPDHPEFMRYYLEALGPVLI